MSRQVLLKVAFLCLAFLRADTVFAASAIWIPAGSVWKFQAITNDIGPTWKFGSFDDSVWPSGPAQLGYGDQDELTIVPFHTDQNGGKNISTYFRHEFNVSSRTLLTNLVLRLLRDDGAVVYLNGVEIFRSNLPEGEIDHSTRALTSIGAPEELYEFVRADVPFWPLITGRNVLAVEIHQVAPTSADISFDLELIAETLASRPPVVTLTAPFIGATYPPGNDIELVATATDPDGTIASVEFFADGASLGVDVSAPFQIVWSDPPPGPHTVTARATDDSGVQTVSQVAPIRVGGVVLLEAGSTWKYLDDQTDPGVAWREPAFDDSGWSNGVAPLGFGDGDEATVIRWKIDEIPIITAYFRRQFVCPDPAHFSGAMLRLLRDDGGIVYLNGVEVFRSNMPEGPVTYSTYAYSSIGTGPEESVIFWPTNLPANLLVRGTNTLAVEVHQITQFSSSDLSFDCELAAFPTAESTRLSVMVDGETLLFSWPAWTKDLSLFATADLTPPVAWTALPPEPEQVDGRWTVRLPLETVGQRYFRLFSR